MLTTSRKAETDLEADLLGSIFHLMVSSHEINHQTTTSINIPIKLDPGGKEKFPYMGCISMCGFKGYGFSAVLVNKVSILADFGHFGH